MKRKTVSKPKPTPLQREACPVPRNIPCKHVAVMDGKDIAEMKITVDGNTVGLRLCMRCKSVYWV